MRSRPDVLEIMVTRDARPGGYVDVRVVLKSSSETPVDAITLKLYGAELFRQAHNQPPALARCVVNQVATVLAEGTLTEGPHTFLARFQLPEDALPSYKGTCLFVNYTLKLHVDIPWWPDLLREYIVNVAPAIKGRPARAPLSQTTARGGDDPFIELTLDDTVVSPGDALSGALALGNLRGRKVRGLRMALITVERLKAKGSRPIRGAEYPVHFAPDAVREGKEFPFRFTIQRSAPTSFDSPATSVSYVLEVRAEMAWQKDLVHSMAVTLAALDRPAEDVRARPHLGVERWRRVWARAGAPLGLALSDPEELRLEGEIAGMKVAVFLDPDADEPSFAVDLEWSPWGIDLRIRLRMISLLASDPDGDGFGRRYKVHGRDPAQVRALLTGPARRALLAFDEAYVDDKHARMKSKAPGFDEPHIGVFLKHAEELARQLSHAGSQIPPPAMMTSMLPAWRAFAGELRADLAVGTMSLRGGSLDGARFDIETVFEEGPDPKRTLLTLIADPPLPEALDPESPEAWVKAPPGTREIVTELRRGALALRVVEHAIELDLEAPLADPGALRPRMEGMLALARRLRGEKSAGPYR